MKNWRNYDTEMIIKFSKHIGCQPNHWKLPLNLTKCSSKKEMLEAFNFDDQDPTLPSCYSIERYSFEFQEKPSLDEFDILNNEFKDLFGLDWNDKEMKDEIVSEIKINFVGKNYHKFFTLGYTVHGSF